jgi:hypothetical protein
VLGWPSSLLSTEAWNRLQPGPKPGRRCLVSLLSWRSASCRSRRSRTTWQVREPCPREWLRRSVRPVGTQSTPRASPTAHHAALPGARFQSPIVGSESAVETDQALPGTLPWPVGGRPSARDRGKRRGQVRACAPPDRAHCAQSQECCRLLHRKSHGIRPRFGLYDRFGVGAVVCRPRAVRWWTLAPASL